jgi:hypothetical protein
MLFFVVAKIRCEVAGGGRPEPDHFKVSRLT